jgi:hypothetical protein
MQLLVRVDGTNRRKAMARRWNEYILTQEPCNDLHSRDAGEPRIAFGVHYQVLADYALTEMRAEVPVMGTNVLQ